MRWPKCVVRGVDLTGYTIVPQNKVHLATFREYVKKYDPLRLVLYNFGYKCSVCHRKYAHFILPTKEWRRIPKHLWAQHVCLRCWRWFTK